MSNEWETNNNLRSYCKGAPLSRQLGNSEEVSIRLPVQCHVSYVVIKSLSQVDALCVPLTASALPL